MCPCVGSGLQRVAPPVHFCFSRTPPCPSAPFAGPVRAPVARMCPLSIDTKDQDASSAIKLDWPQFVAMVTNLTTQCSAREFDLVCKFLLEAIGMSQGQTCRHSLSLSLFLSLTRAHAHTHAHAHAHRRSRTHKGTHTRAHTHKGTRKGTHTHTHTRARTHARTHAHDQIYSVCLMMYDSVWGMQTPLRVRFWARVMEQPPRRGGGWKGGRASLPPPPTRVLMARSQPNGVGFPSVASGDVSAEVESQRRERLVDKLFDFWDFEGTGAIEFSNVVLVFQQYHSMAADNPSVQWVKVQIDKADQNRDGKIQRDVRGLPPGHPPTPGNSPPRPCCPLVNS